MGRNGETSVGRLRRKYRVSNFTAKKLGDLIEKAEIVPAVNQIENHPLLHISHNKQPFLSSSTNVLKSLNALIPKS